MIIAIDVSYQNTQAVANAIVFKGWVSKKAINYYSLIVSAPFPEYVSGKLSQRELPIILALLSKVKEDISTIIIDGYTHKDDLGLGLELWLRLGKRYPVVGLAKTVSTNTLCMEIARKKANKPIYISAVGLGLTDAVKRIKSMVGEHRIPALIKKVDTQIPLAWTATYSWEELWQLPLREETPPQMLMQEEPVEQLSQDLLPMGQ